MFGPVEAEIDGVLARDDADALVAIDEDFVTGEEFVELVDLALELLGEGLALVGPAGRGRSRIWPPMRV